MALTKITTGLIAANTLATANIADNSVDATKIASNSILTRHIDDDQITGDQLADDITIAGNLTVSGNLVTNGASVTNSSTNTTIEDNLIELGTGTTGSPSSDSGIVIERGDSDNAFIGWDESEDKFILGTGSFTGASTGNLTITTAPLVVGALTTSGLSFPTSDGTNGQVLKTDGSGSLTFGDNTTKVDNYTATGDGSTTAFNTGINPGSEVNTWIFIDGVYQQKSQYSYSGSTVTFTTSPQNGALIDVITGTSSNITASDTVLGVYEATTTNTDTYATGISASNENNTWVFVGGVYQPKDSYTFSSGTLTFDANTPTGQKLSVVATKTITAGAVDTSTLAANAVTSAKIASNSILSRHIANNSIVGADISATTQITASTFTGALTGNVTGNVVGNLTGTIQTAAQTNITSVGTLSALTVSGQLTAGGLSYPTSDGTNEQVLRTDGSGNLSFGTVSGTTLNNNTNNYVMTGTGSANTLNGESGLTFDGSTLAVTGSVTSDGLTLSGEGLAYFALGTYSSSAVNNAGLRIRSSTGAASGNWAGMTFQATTGDSSGTYWQQGITSGAGSYASDFVIKNSTGASSVAERLRIDSSGNLLVGKTATALSAAGIELAANNTLRATKANSASAEFNRTGTDGDIAIFWKNTSPVGSIGTYGGTCYMGGSGALGGFMFNGSIEPTRGASRIDATHDLGSTAYRFKDLYLSGGVVFNVAGGTGTSTSGTLDDYEEGTFTPSYTVGGGGSVTGVTSTNVGAYTKVGRMCTVTVRSFYVATSGTIPTYYRVTLPFTAATITNGMTGGGFGQETGQSGAGMMIKVDSGQTSAIIWKYDGTAVPANSYFELMFTYMTA
jgi:hypothetical protein